MIPRKAFFPSSNARRSSTRRRKSVHGEQLEMRTMLAAVGYTSPTHVFSMDDVIGGFDGSTFADDASIINTAATFEDPSNPDPPDYDGPVRAIMDKDGTVLYPVDSEFGFEVTDFDGAVQKVRDGIYQEGYVGNIMEEGVHVGLALSDVETETFKSGLPLGTWAAGLGGNTVKASTEHYVVMQNVLSDQLFPDDPDAVYQLDNDLVIIGGVNDGRLVADVIDELQAIYDSGDHSVDVFPADAPDGQIDIRDVLTPNESTILENIAASDDYSVTLKDDGKLLFRWGTAIKRPTDIRVRAELELPEEWKTEEAASMNGGMGYKILKAELIVNHAITNNPNDQIRPEDLENEAATGRKPKYVVIQHPDFPGDPDYALWVSPLNDFAGDGTFYPSYFKLDANGDIITVPEPGDVVALTPDGSVAGVVNTDASGEPVGTVFREVRPDNYSSSVLVSSDLSGGYTNAWYTTMDRDPFEAVLDENGEYIVGPRWRLKSGKFGQDLPSVDIPLIPHSEPPFTKDNIKYETGENTTTTINLLDWESDSTSPLAYSNGWTMPIPGFDVGPDGVTSEGLQLSDNFDIAFYIKGDIKPARIYDVQLVLTWDADFGTDFGDAPDVAAGTGTGEYQTTLADGGPQHRVDPAILMGANIDAEADAFQNADATGDDTTALDDEDGLVNPVGDLSLTIGQTPTVDVNVTNTTGTAATLFGWIDYNANGIFEVSESASIAVPDGTTAGTVTLTFAEVPADYVGDTFARFRLTTDTSITTATPGGLAEDGEVEDYAATIGSVTVQIAPIASQTIAAGTGSVDLVVASASSDGSIPALTTSALPPFISFTDNGNGTGVFTFNPLSTDLGSTTIIVTATCAAGISTTEEFMLNVVAPDTTTMDQFLYRINSGNGAVGEFQADAFFNTGRTYSTRSTIDLTQVPGLPMAIFQTTRWDESRSPALNYSIPVTPGNYQVNLYFAEIYSPNFDIGERVFDVSLEGTLVLDNFDVYAAAGAGNRAIVRSFNVTADSDIDIDFAHVVENPNIMAIEVIQAQTIANVGPVINPVNPVTVGAGSSSAIQVSASDADGDPVTLSALALPTFASFMDNGNGTATMNFNPDETDAGVYPLTVQASSGSQPLTDSTSFVVTVTSNGIATVSVAASTTSDQTTVPVQEPAEEQQPQAETEVATTSTTTTVTVEPPTELTTDVTTETETETQEPLHIRLNAGGGTGDGYANTGSSYRTRASIDLSDASVPEGTDEALFQTARWDAAGGEELSYSIPVTPGNYEVRLYFAEIWKPAFETGARVFDVTLEDQLVLNDLDVYAEVGGNKGLVKSFKVNTSDDRIDIDFGHVVQNPNIMGIEVIEQPACMTDVDGFLLAVDDLLEL
jgi:hypothetical protein